MSEIDNQAKYRGLMKRVEELVDAIGGEGPTISVPSVADQIIYKFRRELGIYGGRLYERDGEVYLLRATFPDAKAVEEEIRIPRTYPPIEVCLNDGTVYMDAEDPRIDPRIEAALGVEQFAGVEVGEERYILAFDVAPGYDRDDILFSLSVVRHTINQKLRQEKMEDVFRQARRIQRSIQPRRVPRFGSFDFAGLTRTMEEVGGDYYDYIPITDKILGLAIADVTGHGLPAALQVRDIYTGLRMGLGRDFKIVRTVERLNGIIHESTLTSRFVSMIYGELELDGTLIYVNAGHPSPFHLTAAGKATFLDQGGPVLGPLKNATYYRGFVRLQPGDLLVAYTDGITEATQGSRPGGDEYGINRLLTTARGQLGKPASEVVDAIFKSVEAWSEEGALEDDRTVVALTRPEG